MQNIPVAWIEITAHEVYDTFAENALGVLDRHNREQMDHPIEKTSENLNINVSFELLIINELCSMINIEHRVKM